MTLPVTQTVTSALSRDSFVRILGDPLRVLATTADTRGAYLMTETRVACGFGWPLHRHALEDETVLVLSGRFLWQIGDAWHTLETGQSLFVPRGTAHGFRNIAAEPAKLLTVTSPDMAHERLLARIAESLEAPFSAPDLALIAAIAAAQGIELLEVE